MMFSTDTPIPFTVGDLKKHLNYMDNNKIIRSVNGKDQYLSLVGQGSDEVLFFF